MPILKVMIPELKVVISGPFRKPRRGRQGLGGRHLNQRGSQTARNQDARRTPVSDMRCRRPGGRLELGGLHDSTGGCLWTFQSANRAWHSAPPPKYVPGCDISATQDRAPVSMVEMFKLEDVMALSNKTVPYKRNSFSSLGRNTPEGSSPPVSLTFLCPYIAFYVNVNKR